MCGRFAPVHHSSASSSMELAAVVHSKKPTPKVTLRPFGPSDVDAFMAWASDPRVFRFQRRGPYATREDALRYITDCVMPHPWHRAICVAEDGDDEGVDVPRAVGSISVNPVPPSGVEERFKASVGYRVAYDHWGRGIMTAALKAAATAVFREWPWLQRLEAVAEVGNPASQRVLEKAGFRKEGVLRKYVMLRGETRDVVMFGLLAADVE